MKVPKEVPGFIAIRLEVALMREALSMAQRGIASPEDIDTVLKTGHPRKWVTAGIFERVEVGIGWDLILAGVQRVLPDIDSSMDVMKLIQEKVDKGELGAKSGKGFLDWTPESAEATRRKMANAFIEIEKWSQDSLGYFRTYGPKPGCCSRSGACSPPCPSPCRTPGRRGSVPGPVSWPPGPVPPPAGRTDP